MSLELKNISLKFGELEVCRNLSLKFPDRKISVVLGPSGCGKSSLLNLITSVLRSDSGQILGVDDKKISYLFQEPRLLPWLTVKGNLDFVLGEIKDKDKREEIIERFLTMTDLLEAASWYPHALSGGMKQRVAIARAFASPSHLILMDEPFQGLDLKLKLSLMDRFIGLWEEERRTVVLVTHSLEEAIVLGDELFVLSEKPSRLIDHMILDSNRHLRKPGSPLYQQIESRLYKDLTS